MILYDENNSIKPIEISLMAHNSNLFQYLLNHQEFINSQSEKNNVMNFMHFQK